MNKLIYLIPILFCWGCSQNSATEKYQKQRDHIIHVREKVKEIDIEEVLIGRSSRIHIMDSFLIIGDYQGYDELVHIFNKNDFTYLTSIAPRGQGPGEIVNMGHIGCDKANRTILVSDHGKQRIFGYEIDSIFINSKYMPKEKMRMNEKLFPDEYEYINDTLSIGLIIMPIGTSDFKPSVGKWNMTTGEITILPYEHPKIKKKRISYAVSVEHGIYAEFHWYHDLITICDLNGELKYNIYGKNWNSENSNETSYYGTGIFCKDKIVVPYSGKNTFNMKSNSSNLVILPTRLMIFDLNGDYIKTLETEYYIKDIFYDKEINRLILSLNDDIQFGYLDMEGLL